MKRDLVWSTMPGLTIKLVHSEAKALKELRKMGMSDSARFSDATTFWKSGNLDFLVFIDGEKALDAAAYEDVAMLCHEAVHVAQGYFFAIGEDEPSDELYAYTVQSIVKVLVGRHFDWKRKKLSKADKRR